MSHVHAFELLLKDTNSALFFCECGASRTASVDESGRMQLWQNIGPKTPSEATDGSTGRSGNGD
jgi:hypothetical protein